MPIIAMKTTAARAHENADSLRVYTFEAPDLDPTIVVANTSAIYEVGDVVAVALVGTILSDGMNEFEIKKMKVRGVLSFGMALGKRSEPVGTNLTATLGGRDVEPKDLSAEGVVEESVWPRYTSLPGFLAVKDEILKVPEVLVTEKIHGCFAPETPVMLPNGEERAIGDIIADKTITHVLSYDEPTGEYLPKPITNRMRHPGDGDWVQVTLENGRTLRCTASHPFYSRDRKLWVRADEIRPNEDIESPIT